MAGTKGCKSQCQPQGANQQGSVEHRTRRAKPLPKDGLLTPTLGITAYNDGGYGNGYGPMKKKSKCSQRSAHAITEMSYERKDIQG